MLQPARHDGGLLGGLAAGFLGAGLFGMLFGGGIFGGLGGFSSIIGLLLQIAPDRHRGAAGMSWWQRRHSRPAYAGLPRPLRNSAAQRSFALADLVASALRIEPVAALEIKPADYRSVRAAARRGPDRDGRTRMSAKLRTLATPEMVSYFSKDLAENKARNVVNKVADVKLLQGDLAEAWREGDTDYASVAMRYSLIDKTIERTTGRLVEGSDHPDRGHRSVDLRAPRGAEWELSAIQQTS